ncbi:MAG: hypothetical protein EOS70_28865 [Mesorhizobium sp.]|uniref:hypothetical protein n=1 Tax=Mesorhizobium sp. TaxID=1871066 RepID=UPI000FE70BAD|nr:hypothetical protein [Mesorhizobium sp.]RWC27859.1 MAG: hypothetical protein EOS70_28865 [Mesorhizobium sp.]
MELRRAPTTIGNDIGKEFLLHVVGFEADRKIVLRRKIKRLMLANTLTQSPSQDLTRAVDPLRTQVVLYLILLTVTFLILFDTIPEAKPLPFLYLIPSHHRLE